MAISTFSKNLSLTMIFICIQLLYMSCLAQNDVGPRREPTYPEIDNVTIEYQRPHIFVKGDSINVNAIAKCWADDDADHTDHTDDLCVDLMDSLKSKEYKYLSFFALSTVHLKDTIVFPEYFGVALSIISPKWVIHEKTQIILQGLDGDKVQDPPKKAVEGVDGAPGISGVPGGTFFGVGEEFVNGEGLSILSCGGKGGTGQEGGDGRNGRDGRDPVLPVSNSELDCSELVANSDMRIYGFQKQVLEKFRSSYWGYYAYFKIFGERGWHGGTGGMGGKGGKGGPPGTVLFFDMGLNPSGATIKYLEGDEGKDGKGGVGGKAGRHGDHIIAECYYEVGFFSETKTLWMLLNKTPNGKAFSGTNGIDGNSIIRADFHTPSLEDNPYRNKTKLIIGRLLPKPSDIVLEPAIVINSFKSYVREIMMDPSKSESLSLLLKRLESHEDIRNLSEVSGFLDEMRLLEEQFDKLSEEMDFQPFYLSLRDRIEDYAEKNEVRGESRKVLLYLYTAVLSREYNLKYNSESSLIVNIAEHLDDVRSDMDALKKSRKASHELEIMNKKYKKQYEGRMEVKIKEAKDLIENLIKPDLDKIGHELDGKIDSLVAETIELQKKNDVEKIELTKKKKELENKLAWQGFFSIFQLAGQIISFLGSAGASAGIAIGSASSVTDSLALEDSRGERDFELPERIISDLENLEGKIKSVCDRKIERLTEVLDQWNEEAEVYSEQLGDTSVKMTEIKEKLTEGKLDITEVRTLEDEFRVELDKKEKMLESEDSDERNQKALITVQRFKKIVLITEVIADVYKKFKHGASELEALEYAINQAGFKFELLKQYEDKIYDTIVPMVKSMRRDIGFMAREMESNSRVFLVVADWKVQHFLRDTKKNLAKMTQGFETEADISNCLEELQETMSTLVDVYDHIQNYQEQQQLANYIADINSVAGNDIGITNPQFVKPVDELELVIRSNIVLHRYRTAIDAFKQFVFPFASLYLHDFGPLYLNEEGMIAEAVRQIENVQSKLKLYNRSVRNPDRYIAKGDFYRSYKSSSPFYVWKNEDHRSVIGDLLSGKEVLVKADISGSPKRMDAVKFNVVDLYFRTRNGTLQNRIDESLKHFEVRAVHLGNSYYRYDSQVYLLPTTSHEIEFSFETKKDGPVHVGGVYEKIANGDFMLSPYASWKLTLVDITDEADFEELSLFRGEVELELVGRGHYVKNRKINSMDIDVDKYYKAVDEDEKPLVLDVRAVRRKRAIV